MAWGFYTDYVNGEYVVKDPQGRVVAKADTEQEADELVSAMNSDEPLTAAQFYGE